jgi:purine-binding chemotaxis protein CheW
MDNLVKLLLFTLSDLRFALPIDEISKVIRVVAINRIPQAPEILEGMINVHGKIIPVVNLRKFFFLPKDETSLEDRIIISEKMDRPLAILVDDVLSIHDFCKEEILAADALFPGIGFVNGIARLNGDIIYIYNLEKFLTEKNREELQAFLSASPLTSEHEEG